MSLKHWIFWRSGRLLSVKCSPPPPLFGTPLGARLSIYSLWPSFFFFLTFFEDSVCQGPSFSSQLLHFFRQARAQGSIVLLSRPPRPSSPIFHDAPPRSARARFAVHRPPCSPRRPHPEDAPVAGVNVDWGGWTRNTCAVSHLPPSSFPPRGAARAHASRCTTFCHIPPSYRPQLEGAPVWKVSSSTHRFCSAALPS